MSKQESLAESSEDETYDQYIESYCEEFIGQYKKLYNPNKNGRVGLYHLYALEHLCRYGEHMGMDCSWIYEAFLNELSSKNETVLKNYYLGGFISALVDYGCDEATAIAETAHWVGRYGSQSKVRDAYYSFLKIGGNYSPVNLSTMIKSQKLKIAAAFINAVKKDFPKGKVAEGSFQRLFEDIGKAGLENEAMPVKVLIKKNK